MDSVNFHKKQQIKHCFLLPLKNKIYIEENILVLLKTFIANTFYNFLFICKTKTLTAHRQAMSGLLLIVNEHTKKN